MNALAVVDWPLHRIWGEAEEDWHGRWWRQHIPTKAWIQTGYHGWLPEPVFSNGWDPTMWQVGQCVGPWPSDDGTSPWPAEGPSTGSCSSSSRGPDGQAELKQAKREPETDDEEESSGLQKALEILGQLLPRCSRFDTRGFRSQVRRLEREGIPLPDWLFANEPGRVAQFARWAKQVRHEVEFRRRQHGANPSPEEGGSSAGPMPSGAVLVLREMEGLTNSLQSRPARLRREAPLTEEEERGISNSTSSSSSSNSSDEKPRPSGSNAGPRPTGWPAEGQTFQAAEESNSSSLMDTANPKETQSDPGPRRASPEEGDTKDESSDEEEEPAAVNGDAAPVSVATPAAEGGADASLPGEGTDAGGSLPAEGISGHDTLSIATEESWEVQSHLHFWPRHVEYRDRRIVGGFQLKHFGSSSRFLEIRTMAGQRRPFTDDEIASFKGIFPHVGEYSSLKKACVQDLLAREHEDENLAKMGIKQYYFEHCKTFSSSSKKRELELEEKVDEVSQEDFEEIRKKLKGATAQKMISGGHSGRLPAEGKEAEVSLEKKKHKMGKVVLDQVLELEEKLLSCKKEVMDGQQKFPRQPEDNHEELASQLQKAVQSISEKLRPLKRELAAHKKWDLGLKVKVLQRRNSLESQPLACTRPAAAFRKAPNLGHLALTLDECQPAQGSKTWVAAKEIKQKLGWGDEAVIPFALHGDGVPVQGTMRKEGLDFLTINLPAAQDAKHRSPVPFTLLQNDSHWEYDTKDSILKVLLWSMQCLKEGKFPSCRHDGSPWLKSDKQRRTYVGRDLPAKGILVEIRGDWDWLNSWYNIPTYNTKSGMCWLCKATFETFRNSTANERGSDHEVACHRLAKFLAKVYNKVETNEHSGLHKASAKVASQYLALEKEALEAEDSLNWHGFDLLKWLRARYGFLELPIIVISSDTSRECMLTAIEAGCNEWLKKPFNKEELLARLSLAMRVADEVASNGVCPGLSAACPEDIRGVAMHMPELQKRRSSASRLSVPSSRLGRPSLESNDLNVAPRSVSSGLVPPMPESEEEPHSSSDSSDEPSSPVTKTKSNKSNSSVREPAFQQVLSRTETSPKAEPASPVERVSSASARRESRSGPQVPPEQFHQLHGLDCYRLLGRLLPVEAVQQLVCGEVIEPQRCPNAAVLTASLQGVDDVESGVLMDALGHFLDVLGTLSTAEGIVFFSSAELGASFVAVSGLQGTPGHEIQLVRFALAMRDRLDELRKALSSAGEASQLSLAIGLDMGKATRLVLGRLSPHVTITGPAMRKARRLCDEAGIQSSRQGFTQIFVSHLVLRRIGVVLSTHARCADSATRGVEPDICPFAAERRIHGDLEANCCQRRAGQLIASKLRCAERRVCNHSKQPQWGSAGEGPDSAYSSPACFSRIRSRSVRNAGGPPIALPRLRIAIFTRSENLEVSTLALRQVMEDQADSLHMDSGGSSLALDELDTTSGVVAYLVPLPHHPLAMGCGDGGKGMRRLAFKVLCPNELIARIMGKGCRIVVSGRDEFFPGTRWRVLLIYSDRSEAILAVMQHVIRDVIECGAKESPNPEADFLGPDRGTYILRCVVTKQMSSAIIGPKGNNARAIREESGSKVVIDPNITAGHQFVKLVGEPQGLRIALARVNQYVQEQYGSPTYMEWATIKSFDGAGNPIHSGPAETGFSYGSVHGHMGKGGAEWPDERERTPRQGAPATPAQWSGSKGVVKPPQPPVLVSGDDDPESDLLSALSSTAQGFPAGTLDMEYTITCELPSEKVGLLIGKRGEDVQRIRKTTGTYIHFDPAQDGSDGQTLTIRGPLLKVYRAHALLMRRYHETQAEEAPHNGTSTNGDSDQKVQALEEQLQAMQRQLAEVKQLQQSNTNAAPVASAKGRGGGKGSSVPSRDWMALQLRSRHLQLENSQLTQRCQTLQARCQQLQCQRMAFQEQLESAQREARRFEMEVNFLRLGVAQGLLNRP
eukprot:s618_g17.t1